MPSETYLILRKEAEAKGTAPESLDDTIKDEFRDMFYDMYTMLTCSLNERNKDKLKVAPA